MSMNESNLTGAEQNRQAQAALQPPPAEVKATTVTEAAQPESKPAGGPISKYLDGAVVRPVASLLVLVDMAPTATLNSAALDQLTKMTNYEVDGQPVNLANPFAGPKKDKGRPGGLMRPVVMRILSLLDTVNSGCLLLSGKADDRFQALKQMAQRLAADAAKELPVQADTEVLEGVRFDHLVKLDGFLAEPVGEDEALTERNLIVSLRVRIPELLSSKKPLIHINNLVTFLPAAMEKHGILNTPVHLAFVWPGSDLMREEVRLALESMVAETGFEVYGRRDIAADGPEWLPAAVGLRDDLLLNGDFVTSVTFGSSDDTDPAEDAEA